VRDRAHTKKADRGFGKKGDVFYACANGWSKRAYERGRMCCKAFAWKNQQRIGEGSPDHSAEAKD